MKKSSEQISTLTATTKALNEDMDRQHSQLLFASATMKEVYEQIRKVAESDASVLILGENGTGKEVVAREIHRLSQRNEESFIKVDLGALSPELISSELFGHVKGAFTDAREARIGRFELANHGTLFLDEIGNIPPSEQIKLLSVLQNRTVYKVGDHQPIAVDIRLVSATNMPLEQMISDGRFRQDLLYRINTVEIILPPLRERIDDIPLLANHFLEVYGEKYRKQDISLSSESLRKMKDYHWPGNVRELQHAVERAVIMADADTISPSDLLLKKTTKKTKLNSLNVEEIEKAAILQAIDKHHGNLSNAARELGMGRTTLYRKLERYNIQP
jgi:DNA-binding NtrC family response regulator